MQRCKECGASWEVKQTLDVCPFCGADLREKATAYSIEDVFRIILERHGQEVFRNSTLLGLLGDYAPSLIKERKLVKVAVESGAYRAICTASVVERKHVLNKYVSLLTDSYFIDETWARKALMWCLCALSSDSPAEEEIGESNAGFDLNFVRGDSFVDDDINQTKKGEKAEVVDPDMVISEGILKKYRGAQQNLEIPTTVHTIASGAFHSNNDICTITIPYSVRDIEKSAFAYCENLEYATIENGVKEIGEWAFVNCKKLRSITIPDSVINIGQYAFQGCSALATAQLSNAMTVIEEGTFFACKLLTSVSFPKKLKTIKKMAFKDCKSIKNLLLPEYLETIDDNAFSCCWSIRKVTVTSSIKLDPSIFGHSFGSDGVEIKYLGKAADSYDSELVISNVSEIPNRWKRDSKWINASSIIVKDGIDETPMEAFAGMENLQSITLPKDLKKIGFGSFKNCPKLNNVVIPDTVTTISAHAFEKCSRLASIVIPDSVRYIGDDAFRGCPISSAYVNTSCVICSGNYQIKNKK